MMTDVQALVASATLTFVMLLTASLLRTHGWSPAGMKLAFGNRADLPEASPLAARADRAAKNMLENLLLFLAVFGAARAAGAPSEAIAPGAVLFFWARVAYFLVYLAGVPYLRTGIWFVAVAGLVMVGRAAL